MNTPDPSNEPETSLGKSLAEIRGRIEDADLASLTIEDIQRALRGDDEPDALAQLEAWLRGKNGRKIIVNDLGDSGLEVVLRVSSGKPDVIASERDTGFANTAIAKAPGLAATIDAALAKADEVGL